MCVTPSLIYAPSVHLGRCTKPKKLLTHPFMIATHPVTLLQAPGEPQINYFNNRRTADRYNLPSLLLSKSPAPLLILYSAHCAHKRPCGNSKPTVFPSRPGLINWFPSIYQTRLLYLYGANVMSQLVIQGKTHNHLVRH